jgi:hypothetical protein
VGVVMRRAALLVEPGDDLGVGDSAAIFAHRSPPDKV